MLTVLVGASVRRVGSLCAGGQVALLGPWQLVAPVDLLKEPFVHLERRRCSVCRRSCGPCWRGEWQARSAPGLCCQSTKLTCSRIVIL